MSFKELLFTFILSVHTTVRTFLFLFIKEVESVPHLYLYFCLREECVHFFPPSLRQTEENKYVSNALFDVTMTGYLKTEIKTEGGGEVISRTQKTIKKIEMKINEQSSIDQKKQTFTIHIISDPINQFHFISFCNHFNKTKKSD